MFRVLHCVSKMDRGGVETLLMNIYRKIDRNNVQFDFLVHTDKECEYDQEIKELGGRIFSIPSRSQGILKNYYAIHNFFEKQNEYKIVHQHVSSLTYITPLRVAKKFHIPVRIVHSHNTKQGGSYFHKYLHKLNQTFIKFYATHYLACSKLAAKWLYPRKLYKRKEFTIINNAIETERFVFNEEKRVTKRKELGIDNKFVIGHVGRFMHQKNHEFLIDIFKTVFDKNENAVLLLVGDGNLRSIIEEKVNRLCLTNNVIFTGVRSDIPELLQAMDVFVMPSHHEGLPLTVIEAQAAGLPCVLSKNITREVEILKHIKWCKLSDESSKWANNILSFMGDFERVNTQQEIKKAGYDINSVADYIHEMYVESLK